MGTTVILLTEGEPQLAGAEQVTAPRAPGSWRAIAWEDRYPLDQCGADGAEPRSYWWIHRDSDPANELSGWVSEADARLIAAAPDMLAAIKNSDDAHWTPAMRDAIAKAEGRTP